MHRDAPESIYSKDDLLCVVNTDAVNRYLLLMGLISVVSTRVLFQPRNFASFVNKSQLTFVAGHNLAFVQKLYLFELEV